MRKLILLAVLACAPTYALTCQSGFVEIAGTALNPDSSLFNGQMVLNFGYNTVVSGDSVRQNRVTLLVTSGVVDVCLAPGNYTNTNSITGSRLTYPTYWTVPSSGGPYTVQQVESSTPVTPTLQIALNQIAANVANGTYCLQVTGGVVTALVACSGGSGPAWSSLNNSQWTSLTNSQWTSLSN